ncbi:MAG: nucleotidyltransferase domain-containing protein [Clostridium sp.]|nr:nucleotidyltransferase domain-containing protein [Clostridium sp.]
MLSKEIEYQAIKFIEKINENYKIKFAYLFGSRARGDFHKESDIDLALYFEENYNGVKEVFIKGNIIEEGKKYFGIPVDIVYLNKAPLILKHEIVKEGIVLKDSYDRADFESLVLREYFDFKYYSDQYDRAIIESIKKEEYFRR